MKAEIETRLQTVLDNLRDVMTDASKKDVKQIKKLVRIELMAFEN